MFSKAILRVGILQQVPWSFIPEGEKEWTGFCIDLIHKLAEFMNFEYEIVVSKDRDIEEHIKENEGIIDDIISGKIDMAIAPFTVSAAKAELVDFITPYFENSGLTAVIRKPVKKSAFFRFMTVLSLDVWLSIINAIVITALTLWLIDKVLPTNLIDDCGKPRRKFTIKESLWLSIMTFTSIQEGGEIPSSVAQRILIASYWIFVLIMLTTFTANLAAFLTVERLRTPVRSLWELVHQNRIKFTVVRNSHAHLYFRNMKMAEETLFRIWKDLAINQSSENEKDFTVWDYPIKQDFRHALTAIESNSPVPNASVGFQKVLESKKGEFALIHDASEIRYHVYQDCRFIEIGDIFGERPYSIAVKKNSKMKNEITNRILDLHEERYFEYLSAKYWNTSNLVSCAEEDDSRIVTLESLGGVFISVNCGIVLAISALIIEVIWHRCKRRRRQKQKQQSRQMKLKMLMKIYSLRK